MELLRFYGIVRNTITHHGMYLSSDAHNELNSIDPHFLKIFFTIMPEGGRKIIHPSVSEHFDEFGALVTMANDFMCNTVKFMHAQTDLRFLGLM